MNKQHLLVFILTALSFLTRAACGGEDDDREQLDVMKYEILKYVGTPLCEGESVCRSIGFGTKPCGGPWSYLIYSVSNVDSLQLFDMVSDYNRFNAELNEEYILGSDCGVLFPPELGCNGGQCVDLNAIER